MEFYTSRGLPFTYKIKTNAAGEKLEKALELGGLVTGPKKLGVFGASYIYPVFVEIGVYGKQHSTERI